MARAAWWQCAHYTESRTSARRDFHRRDGEADIPGVAGLEKMAAASGLSLRDLYPL
jgi:hypothetical protein